MATAVRVRVTGHVQGVNFRAWTRAEAERRGLTGWVRNEADGAVSALVVGDERAVEGMVAALGKGPRAAAVERVETEPAEADPPPAAFTIAR